MCDGLRWMGDEKEGGERRGKQRKGADEFLCLGRWEGGVGGGQKGGKMGPAV